MLFIKKLACIRRSNCGARHVASISGCDAMVHYIRVYYVSPLSNYIANVERIREEEKGGEISEPRGWDRWKDNYGLV